jgi:ubiquitin thioesterase OTU1
MAHAVKTGYPPRSLTLVPELPLSSLGLVSGDQLIVTQKLGSTSSVAQSVPPIAATTAPTATARTFASPAAAPAPSRTPVGAGQPDFVETDAGVLIHRVCLSLGM